MTTPRESNPTPGHPSSPGIEPTFAAAAEARSRDEALREALRALPQDRADVDALASRVMAQWRERESATVAVPATLGHGLALLGGHGYRRMRWIGIAGLLTGAVIAVVFWTHRPDPAMDELLQPDVLSQMAIGEM